MREAWCSRENGLPVAWRRREERETGAPGFFGWRKEGELAGISACRCTIPASYSRDRVTKRVRLRPVSWLGKLDLEV